MSEFFATAAMHDNPALREAEPAERLQSHAHELAAVSQDALTRVLNEVRAGVQGEAVLLGLTPDEQLGVIALLRLRGHTPLSMARELHVSPTTAARLCARVDESHGQVAISISRDGVVGQLAAAAQAAMDGHFADGNWTGYWKVQREYLQDLMRLGIVREAARKVDVTHKLDDGQVAELERLRELDRKRESRLEEIERARVDRIDPIPMLGTVDVPDQYTSFEEDESA